MSEEENAQIDFDAISKSAEEEVKKEEKRKQDIAEGIIKEEREKLTKGWKKGPLIAVGIFAAAVIALSIWVFCF